MKRSMLLLGLISFWIALIILSGLTAAKEPVPQTESYTGTPTITPPPGLQLRAKPPTPKGAPPLPERVYSTETGPLTFDGIPCYILLVDDDWDCGSPNGGGRPYYTSTLDYLGYPYDVWDTVTQGTPGGANMAPYDVVIWFTGYDWETPVSPTEEAELGKYLSNGGNLILSSQEQHFAYGLTVFMQNYLGVASMVDDVVITRTVGIAGNPISNGLGPYTMARPDDWDAYWPNPPSQGPYDDEATAGPSAAQTFRYDAPSNTNTNSTNYDSGTFKTIFLAWPFEWIDTTTQRAEILGAALNWMCPKIYLPLITKNYTP